MDDSRSEVRWSPRVPKGKIRRLYESDARGLLDDELLDDVGIALLLRCQDILMVVGARQGSAPRRARTTRKGTAWRD